MWTRGTVTQKFKISLDIDKLMEYIADNILAQISADKDINSVDFDEYYIEDDNLEIRGSYDTDYESYYSPATRWDPAEYDLNRAYIGDGTGLLDNLPAEIQKLIYISNVDEDEGDAEYHVPEPDYDRAYDEYRDRLLEEN